MKNNWEELWLEGFYPPSMDDYGSFHEWGKMWTTGPHGDEGWVYFPGDDYSEASARMRLNSPPKDAIWDKQKDGPTDFSNNYW